MKYIKLFEDNVNKSTRNKSVFYIDDIKYIIQFTEITKNDLTYYDMSYGVDNNGEIDYNELNLGVIALVQLLKKVAKLTSEFLIKYKPEILCIEHKDMNNEDFVPDDKLNKRARSNYRFINNLIPDNYILSYWSNNNIFQTEDDVCSTTCIIYRKDINIEPLVEHKIKINF